MSDLTERLIALQLTPHLGEKTLSGLLEGGSERVSGCFGASEECLREDYLFHPKAATFFSKRREKLMEDAELLLASLRRAGADVLPAADARYPARLRKLPDHSPLLYAAGDLRLLEEPSICFLASNGAILPVVARLRLMADAVARQGYPIVTGHNRDVYQASGLAAAQHSSPVIYVLDGGLLAANSSGQDGPFAAARIHPSGGQRQLYLSPFRPKDPWIGHNNRKRDRIIAALAQVLVAVEIRPGGVMERECQSALGRGQRVVAVAPDGRIPESHSRLFDRGARLIQTEEELLRHLWDAGLLPP